MKAVVVFGTRPEVIKLAPVMTALSRRGVQVVNVATAQHRELLEQALRVFGIVPDYDLNVMQPNQRLCDLTARILPAMDAVLREERPDVVIVQGDTTTVFAGALSAFYSDIPVAHVEAGLRSHDMRDPFPEESNRKLTAALTRWHFAPTERARANLLAEGVAADRIHVTGNTITDALQLIVASEAFTRTVAPVVPANGQKLVLVTLHRRESWGPTLEGMCRALVEVTRHAPHVHFVFPVHLNPIVRGQVEQVLGSSGGVTLLEPLDYLTFLRQMQESWLVVTDSGGVQEEAPSMAKPVLVLRRVTERMEGVETGVARLVGVAPEAVRDAILDLVADERAYRAMAVARNPFGDGRAAGRIADVLTSPH